MRIAILNWDSRPVGGIDTYLRLVVPALARHGHELAFLHERGTPPDGDRFGLPAGSPAWSGEHSGAERALASLSEWQPHVLFSHGSLDPHVESSTLRIAPSVFMAHAYYGTCISGAKTFKSPSTLPCSRRFGWPCLLNYYPRHCGGWNPLTMAQMFRLQSRRLRLLSSYNAVVVYSTSLQRELARHGIDATYLTPPTESRMHATVGSHDRDARDEWRLLFAGRMDHLKGGSCLLDALPSVARALNRRVHVTFAGDGPAKASWEAAAATLAAREPALRIFFAGWLDREKLDALYARADLLVVPSLWPEPFGFVGPEAGRQRLPAAAFAVGGIPDWLRPGINGFLAPGDPPTARGLTDAIIACLKNQETHAQLRDGAARVAAEFNLDGHVDALLRVLNDVARSGVDASTMVRADGRP